ncbi:MAG: PAS domain S-box protein [Desulfobacteraceae bacterium]|nr:PAS domain S-box protein [Desulfobacteraceae bacterium]
MKCTAQKTLNLDYAERLIDAMAEGMFTVDAHLRITFWNRSMEHITGYKAAEAIGKKCSFFEFNQCFQHNCPPDFEDCGIFELGKVDGKECLLKHKQGHMVPILKNARVVLNKAGDLDGVVETVTDLTELKKTRALAEAAERRLAERHRVGNIVGKSPGMLQVFGVIQSAAASEATILIQGESGTGKELVASAIHYGGNRSGGPLVTVNCASLSESLLESELFGHVKGAFTGALRDRVGRFEQAHGGTIFLDEIGEISPFIQVKLLRVLQDRQVQRVGESRSRKIDIRIIAATHQDLFSQVKSGRFRQDLFYRLKIFPIHVPPLRERKEDIALLIEHFVRRQNKKTGKTIKGITPTAMRLLMDYSWKGNVRELENAIEHAFVLCSYGMADVDSLPVEIRNLECPPARMPSTVQPARQKKKLTRQALTDLLRLCNWNKAEAARRIGVSRTAVWKYMKKWGIPLKKP